MEWKEGGALVEEEAARVALGGVAPEVVKTRVAVAESNTTMAMGATAGMQDAGGWVTGRAEQRAGLVAAVQEMVVGNVAAGRGVALGVA